MSSVSSVSSSNLSRSDGDQGPKEAEDNQHQNPANNCIATSAAPAFDEEAALRARIDEWKIAEKERRQKEKRKAIERRLHEKERKKRLENLVAGTTTSPTKHGQQQRDKAAENHFQSLEEIREKYLLEKKANTREFQIKQGQHRRAQMQEYGRHAEESNFAEVTHNPDSTNEDGSGNNNNNNNKRRDPSKPRKTRDIMAEALKRHEPMAMQAPAMADHVTKKSQLAPEEELARQKKIVAVGNQYMREAKLKAKASAQGNDDLATGTSSALAPAQQQQFEREQQEEQQRKKIKALGDNYLRQLRLERMEKDKATPNETSNEGEPPTAVAATTKSAQTFVPRRKHDDSQLASSMPIEKQQQKQEALAKARKEVLALNRKMLLAPLAPLPHQINANSPTATSAPTGTLLATNSSSPFPPKRAGPSTVGTNGRLPPMQQLSASSGPVGSGEAQLDPIVEAINAKMKLLKMLGNNQGKSPTAGDNGAAALGPVRPMRNLKPLTK